MTVKGYSDKELIRELTEIVCELWEACKPFVEDAAYDSRMGTDDHDKLTGVLLRLNDVYPSLCSTARRTAGSRIG